MSKETYYSVKRDLVNTPSELDAKLHQTALYDFMINLYTSPPTSWANMKHKLEDSEALGAWTNQEKKRVVHNFKVFATAEKKALESRGESSKGKGSQGKGAWASQGHERRQRVPCKGVREARQRACGVRYV